mgnify:CR=1 FL=1
MSSKIGKFSEYIQYDEGLLTKLKNRIPPARTIFTLMESAKLNKIDELLSRDCKS